MPVHHTGGHLRALLVPGEILASPITKQPVQKDQTNVFPELEKKKEERITMITVIVLIFFVLTYYTPPVKKSWDMHISASAQSQLHVQV